MINTIVTSKKKVSSIGIGIGIDHYGSGYRRYSEQSIGIGNHGIVPSLVKMAIFIILYNT